MPEITPSESHSPGRFCIVTPVFNGAEYIDETLASLFSQAGPFHLRVHVRDGGSTDDTVLRLRAWELRLRNPLFPRFCLSIEFSYLSEKDGGMYDAIQKASPGLVSSRGDLLTWLNADDFLVPGALRFVWDRMAQFPEMAWLTGRPCEADAGGAMRRVHEALVFSRAALAAGLHDGRRLPFVMQECTFWRGSLWLQSGGLRTDLRLTGDYELWMRFARFAELHSSEVVLGVHRRRPNQLSAAGGKYYLELDECVAVDAAMATRDEMWASFQAWSSSEPLSDGIDFRGPMLDFHPEDSRWSVSMRKPLIPLWTPVHASADGKHVALISARFGEGFTGISGPTAYLNLLRGYRLATPGVNHLELQVPAASVYSVYVRFRNFHQGMHASIRCREREVFGATLPLTLHDRNGELVFEVMLETGSNQLQLEIKQLNSDPCGNLMVLAIEALPVHCAY